MKRPYYITPTRPARASRSPQRTFAVLLFLLGIVALWNWFVVVSPEIKEQARGEAQARSVRYILDSSPAVVAKEGEQIVF